MKPRRTTLWNAWLGNEAVRDAVHRRAYHHSMASNYYVVGRPGVALADGQADLLVCGQTDEDLLRREVETPSRRSDPPILLCRRNCDAIPRPGSPVLDHA